MTQTHQRSDASPRFLLHTRTGYCWFVFLLVLVVLLAPIKAGAQLIPGSTNSDQDKSQENWTPPDVTALPQNWWSQFETHDAHVQQERAARFMLALRDRAKGLSGDDKATTDVSIANLESLAELLYITAQDPAEESFDPLPTQQTYSLSELLSLREFWRRLDKEVNTVTLQLEPASRQIELLQSRQDGLLRQYQALDSESPGRILTGIDQITARLEYELAVVRAEKLEARLAGVNEQSQLVTGQLDYALENLDPGEFSIKDVEDHAEKARTQVAQAGKRVTVLQAQLLDVISEDPVNASLELLRNQQLTGATAALELARIESKLATTVTYWHRLRIGVLDLGINFRADAANARDLTAQVLQQAEVWVTTSQSTLVSPSSSTSANARANNDIAQSEARKTLEIIERIRAASGELLLVQEILATELVASQSGLRRVWSSISLALAGAWDGFADITEFKLFSIGETPVTLGGIVKMVLIIALAWTLSWVVRYLIGHASAGGDQFTRSPAAYTLGRILHYVLITVGLFVAFTSIGFDFTSFALIAGALSVGIGFGLQAIVNNFVSGLILLLEGSLRIGDYIELDSGIAGSVKEINTRATVVNTNDNVDVVVPNSELVTSKLTNWTLRESVARMRVPFGVAYGSDKEQVREAALAAAAEVEFVLNNMPRRQPEVRLYNFGDSALEFEMMLWVSRAGVRRPHRIRCDFLWHLETRLREAGIEIPFPQRDLHLRSDFREPVESSSIAVEADAEPNSADK